MQAPTPHATKKGPTGTGRVKAAQILAGLAWLTGSPLVIVVTAEKAGPKVVSILVWKKN